MLLADPSPKKYREKGEAELFLFTSSMMLHMEDPKYLLNKLFELIYKFSKVEEYRINIENSNVFLYTCNE